MSERILRRAFVMAQMSKEAGPVSSILLKPVGAVGEGLLRIPAKLAKKLLGWAIKNPTKALIGGLAGRELLSAPHVLSRSPVTTAYRTARRHFPYAPNYRPFS